MYYAYIIITMIARHVCYCYTSATARCSSCYHIVNYQSCCDYYVYIVFNCLHIVITSMLKCEISSVTFAYTFVYMSVIVSVYEFANIRLHVICYIAPSFIETNDRSNYRELW